MKKSKTWTEEKGLILIIAILSIAVIVLFVYVYYTPKSTTSQYSAKIIEIVGDCKECFDVKLLTESVIQENNLNVKSRETFGYNSKEAKKVISKYKLKTVPSLIILSKEINKIKISNELFSIKENYAVFEKGVPYFNLETNKVKGLVKLTEIIPNGCAECNSLFPLRAQLEKSGVKITDYEIVNLSSNNGKDIIEKDGLTFAPTLLISKDIEEYWWLFDQIKSSLIEKEGHYILKDPVAPYINLNDGRVKGKVDLVYIENKSCEDCFNVTQLKASFQNLGVYFNSEKRVDVSSSEGKNLLSKHNITAIPTVILSNEIQDYSALKNILEQIGNFEVDGKFVFRKLESLNVKYQELSTNRSGMSGS